MNEVREIASLTKIMTCMVCFRLLKRFKISMQSLYFSVSSTAAALKGTSANLEENDWVLIEVIVQIIIKGSIICLNATLRERCSSNVG